MPAEAANATAGSCCWYYIVCFRNNNPCCFILARKEPVQPPLNVDMNPLLEEAVLAMQHGYMPDKSNNIYDDKTTSNKVSSRQTNSSTDSCFIKRFLTQKGVGA
jgi:hypothetical protein